MPLFVIGLILTQKKPSVTDRASIFSMAPRPTLFITLHRPTASQRCFSETGKEMPICVLQEQLWA